MRIVHIDYCTEPWLHVYSSEWRRKRCSRNHVPGSRYENLRISTRVLSCSVLVLRGLEKEGWRQGRGKGRLPIYLYVPMEFMEQHGTVTGWMDLNSLGGFGSVRVPCRKM